MKYDRDNGDETLIALAKQRTDWIDEAMPPSHYFGNEICFITKMNTRNRKVGEDVDEGRYRVLVRPDKHINEKSKSHTADSYTE